MKNVIKELCRKMSDCIIGFWVVDEEEPKEIREYTDYPVRPFGPQKLISKKTIKDLIK